MLEQELRDERARRRDAEKRLAETTDKAEVWRRRAEERTARIERLLEAQQKPTNRLRRWLGLSSSTAPPTPPSESATTETVPVTPRFPSWPTQKPVVVVAAVDDPGKLRALETFDLRPARSASDSDLDRADMVVFEPGAVGRDRLIEWAGGVGRQPLLVWGDDPSDSALAPHATALLASDAGTATRLGVPFVPGSFDPRHHNPIVGQVVGDHVHDLFAPSLDTIEQAAAGGGFSDSPGAGVLARRWAYRRHAPWVRAGQLLGYAGLPARKGQAAIAALLVSHRPGDVPAALDRLTRQTLPPSQVVVVVHGSDIDDAIARTASASPFQVDVLASPRDRTLGECLDLAASRTSAAILAKIDDDDHYGPGYLEDSFHALCYSGADVVGKGAHFTYVAGVDRTVVRHPGVEEQFTQGSPNGATLVFRRDIWERGGFPDRPRHVDTGFLRAARLLGATVFAASRWEFCYVRRADGHTWDADDEVFLAGSEPAWEGFRPDLVELEDLDGA